MYKNFCCPKCGSFMNNELEWECFIESNGLLKNRAFLIFNCCSGLDKIEILDNDYFKLWAELEDSKSKFRQILWNSIYEDLDDNDPDLINI